MKFRIFYFFYLLTILLLIAGLITEDTDVVVPSWHTTILRGMWSFFIPAAIGSLLIGLIYHYWFNIGQPVSTIRILVHFLLFAAGLFLSTYIYRLVIVLINSGMPDAVSVGDNLFFIIVGPLLLLLSFVVFVRGLMITKHDPK